MLLHFKLNCFIFLMLVGQINLGEKVSRNTDAFFDPSVDDLQDNFYDIPFIPNNNNNNNNINEKNVENIENYDELSEHDIFQYGREKLIENPKANLNTDLAEIRRLSEIKNEIDKREIENRNKLELLKRNDDCFQSQTLNDSAASSDGLLDSVVQKFNQIGKEKNSLHLRMQNIEDDEAVLENENGRTYDLKRFRRRRPNSENTKIIFNTNHRVKRNIYEDLPIKNQKRRNKYINSLYFSHKYRHKNIVNCNNDEVMKFDDVEPEEAPQIGKRMCNRRPKIPHKHKAADAPFQSSKHEAFIEELLEDNGCNLKTSVDESGCNTTKKHQKEHTTETTTTTTTTKKKHKQLAAKGKEKATTLKAKNSETCDKDKPVKELAKKAEVTKHQLNPLKKQKSSIPPTKPSIKSVLCHKNPTSTTTTTTTTTAASELEEYEDYKAGDYIETEKDNITNKKHKQDDLEFCKIQRRDCKKKPNSGGSKDAIEEFLREETTEDNSNLGQQLHQSPVLGTKSHKEDAIDQFLKEETTKTDNSATASEAQNDYKRNVYQFEELDDTLKTGDPDEECHVKTSGDEIDEDASKKKKNSTNNLDRFINGEIPKTEIFQFPSSSENGGTPLQKHKQILETEKNQRKKTKNKNDFQLKRTAYLTPIFNNKKINKLKMQERLQQKQHSLFGYTTEKIGPETSRKTYSNKEFYTPEKYSTFTKVTDNPEIYEEKTTERYTPRKIEKPKIFIVKSKYDKVNDEEPEENKNSAKPHVKLKQRVFIVKPKIKQHNQKENFENSKKFVVHGNKDPDGEIDKYSGKNSLKHFEEVVLNEEGKNKKSQNKNLGQKQTYNIFNKNDNNEKNHIEYPENEIINYIQEMINNRRMNLINNNKHFESNEDRSQHLNHLKNNPNEKVVNIKEMNKKLELLNEQNKFTKTTENSAKTPNSKLYVAHTKNQGRQHHIIYFEPEKLKTKTKQKTHSKIEFNRNPREDYTEIYSNYETTETLNKYEKFLERLKNKNIFSDEDEYVVNKDEVTTKKIKHQIETDTEDDIIDATPETFTEPETNDEENPEIDELYSEIPVDKKRIQLSLNCDSADYNNKDHCICSVQTMLRDLMDDLKDINTSINYQYDCSKYIGIQPGIVIANDSRALELRDRRDIFFKNFMMRKGLRIGRDVDSLLNDNLNVDNLDNSIYATVGSKVVLHCGNSSDDYNTDDKIVWTVRDGAPETAGFKEDNGHELIIERVTAQDTNNYTCAISHKLEDGTYTPSKKYLHKLSIVELPIYSLMITVLLNESAKCEEEDLETLHNYYPVMLNKFLCHGAEQICSISVDKAHCTKSHSENGVTMHATLKSLPLYGVLPALRNKQQLCGISCQSRIYSIIVKTLQNNFASVANLPGITKSINNLYRCRMKSATSPTCFPIPF